MSILVKNGRFPGMMHWSNLVAYGLHRLKTQWLYRLVFGRIGRGSVIGRPVLISNPQFIHLGARVSVRDGVRLEVVDHRPGKTPCLTIGGGTNIEQNVHIVCHDRVTIGERVTVTANCAIVDVSHPYEDVHNPAKVGDRLSEEDAFVEIGDCAFLGIGTIILPNVRVGRHAVIGAHSVVTRSVPDYCVAIGSPARIIKRYDPEADAWVPVNEGAAGNAARLAA